ncbi:MAG: aldehyde dehydrogenase family protein [Candidatus Omnitrophota bacterium]
MTCRYSLYLNGEFKETSQRQAVINPATGEMIAEACLAGDEDVNAALSAARLAFDQGPWTKISPGERKDLILKISQGILDRAAELARLETLNTGKPIKESTFMDIPSSAQAFSCLANNFERYLKEEALEIKGQAQCRLQREPVGVVVLIVPWNYPLLIASWKMASALCAGNTIVLKPSSLTPLTTLELARIIDDAGIPKGVVNIINASGEKVGRALCADKRVDMISFTGSNEAGRKIAEYSSSYIKKTIMELGGKSAAVVFKDADLETAANGLLCSIFLNQGQMCTAMSRILVEEDIYDDFASIFKEKAKRIKLGPGIDYQTQMGPLISRGQRDKVIACIEKAKQEGAKILCGGNVPQGEQFKSGFFLEPAVFTEVRADMAVFQEEIFGPVACICKFSGIDEAAKIANNSSFALAGAIWTKDQKKALDLAERINAGIIWINTYGMFYSEAPYGGFKQSGFGKELGREGFLEYTRLKNTIISKEQDSRPLVSYWYGF